MPSAPTREFPENTAALARRRPWWKALRLFAVAVLLTLLCVAYLLQDHYRSLASLRRVPGTNAYVMDYYVDYNIEEIRSQGMDVKNIENGLIDVFFPDLIVPLARRLKAHFIQNDVEIIQPDAHHCSTVVLRPNGGNVYFGRNFDWKHDACLIVKTHVADVPASIAVIDLHYLDLDRTDLESTSLIERIPLLFAPYYLQDGMNEYGVAVADMSVADAKAPYNAAKPNILHSTAMRLILDYAKTTDEAIALLRQYNIHFGESTAHLMIADSAGRSAVVEFFDGELIVTSNDETWQVCTNHRIAGTAEQQSDQTCDRYCRASDQLAVLASVAEAADVMKIMESVAQPSRTMWTSVYNLSRGELQFAYRQHYGDTYREALDVSN